MDPSSSKAQLEQLKSEREQFRAHIAADDDDALAPYERYTAWLTGQAQAFPEGPFDLELLTVLEEAVRSRKDDPDYENDVRYVKLWLAYARRVEKSDLIYVYLLRNGIGGKNAQLYEDYATSLETQDRFREAEETYRLGISRSKRGADRLKARYKEFKQRTESKSTLKNTHKPLSIPPGESSSLGAKLYQNPLRNFSKKRINDVVSPQQNSSDAPSSKPPSSTSPAKKESSMDKNYDPYAHMRTTMDAPMVPGKKAEKYKFDMSLLFKDGQEFCIQEARAASLGLLGKKWGPPPKSEAGLRHMTGIKQTIVGLRDEESKPATRTNHMRLNMNMTAQLADGPTVTLNTKEAMKDVFGMFNSPDRTQKTGSLAIGTKFAPVKKFDPLTALQPQPSQKKITDLGNDENGQIRQKSATFRPYVDTNDKDRKENVTPAAPKFKPFVDENADSKTPRVVPKPRKGLAVKDVPPASSIFRPLDQPEAELDGRRSEESQQRPVFSVFTPASQLEKSKPKVLQERTPVFRDPQERKGARSSVFESKVFSRPPEARPLSEIRPSRGCENGEAKVSMFPRSSSTPNHNSFTPVSRRRKEPVFSNPRAPLKPVEPEPEPELESRPEPESALEEKPQEEIEEYEDDFESGSPVDEMPGDADYYEEDPQNLPMGGRFGRFDVLTPIAERTFECTMTQRTMLGTDGGLNGPIFQHGHRTHDQDAALAAEKLARELQEEELRQKKGVNMAEDEESEQSGEAEDEDLIERTGTLSLADAIAVASSFKPSNPCNPSDPHIVNTLLSLIPPESDFVDLRTEVSGRFDNLRKFATEHNRRNSGRSSSSSRSSDGAEPFYVTLPDRTFVITDKLGEGGFGTVFKAKVAPASTESDDEDMELDDEDANLFALKVVKPRNLWEFHILRRLRSVLPPPQRQSVVSAHALYTYRDESFLVLDLCNQGTLLDVVNHAAGAGVLHQGACLDELLVMFFAIELIKFVESMHSIGYIHGDLKIDNCLLRLEEVPGGTNAWSGMYQSTGEGGWKYKGIKMIDFGRTIDTRMYPAGQKFVADWKTDVYDCPEMRENRPWTYETDYFGLAGIIYVMLFGKYFDAGTVAPIPSTEPMRYKLSSQFKRYWQSDLWSRLFDLLLNPKVARDDHSLPLVPELASLREEMETWLSSNCNRSTNTLKGLLKKIERSVLSGSSSR